jgi:DNA-binding MarR family transcriptional regulator
VWSDLNSPATGNFELKFKFKFKFYYLSRAQLFIVAFSRGTLFSQPDGIAHPSDLCVRADQSPSNLSRISDTLFDRGLLTRDLSVQDPRPMVLRITEKGEALVSDLLPESVKHLRNLLSNFSDTEQRGMTMMLRNLGDCFANTTTADGNLADFSRMPLAFGSVG